MVRKVEGQPEGTVRTPRTPRPGNQAMPFAEITDVGTTAGTYKAKEKVWDGTAFIDLVGGRLWDEIVLPALVEVNLNAGIAVGQIVRPRFHGDNGTGFAWFFDVPATAPHPFRTTVDPDDDTKLLIGLDRVSGNIGFDTFTVGKQWQRRNTLDTFIPPNTGFVVYEIRRNAATGNEVADMDVTLEVIDNPTAIPSDAFFSGGSANFSQGVNITQRYNVIVGHVTVDGGGVITNWTQHRSENFAVEERHSSIRLNGRRLSLTVNDPQSAGNLAILTQFDLIIGDGPKFSIWLQHKPTASWNLTVNDETANPGSQPPDFDAAQDGMIRIGDVELDVAVTNGVNKIRKFRSDERFSRTFWTNDLDT